MKRFPSYLLVVICILISAKIFAQTSTASDYERVITGRTAKIVASLKLEDSIKAAMLTKMIADQNRSLGQIHDKKNEQEAAIKKQENVNRVAIDSEIKKLEDEANNELERLHTEYLLKLSSLLSPDKIELVKDGMTYNVTSVTYNAYLDMLPQLTIEQKTQIMKWLKEAREQAMDAESSEKKHWWFGKYKGRINNYLAKQGYDLKKANENWAKRRSGKKDPPD